MMKQNNMRKSQTVMLSALGVMAFIVVMLVGVARVAVSSMDTGSEQHASRKDYSVSSGKNLDIRDFDSIRLVGSWKVKLIQGDDWHVELNYPDGRKQDLKATVEDGRLTLDPGDYNSTWDWNWWKGWNNKEVYSARIVLPKLKSLEIAGASNLNFDGFSGGDLRIIISGAGNLEGEQGHYDNLSLIMSGAGNVDMRDMKFTDALVNLSGAGNVRLGMDGGVLSGNLSGFGNIEYYGPVKDERVNVSGFGKVHPSR